MNIKDPHILLIVLDTLRRDHLSLYGYPRETSPFLDLFAQRGTRFERAIAPAQWTIPAHASLFTGLYPGLHQVTQVGQQLSGMRPTMAEILRLAGYHTVAFCNNPLVGVLDHGLQRGFDAFYNYAGATPNRPVDMTRGRLRRKMAERLRRSARHLSNQFARSDELFRLSLHPLLTPLWVRWINYKGDTERSISDLIDYWGAYARGGATQPLFVFVNLMGAHLPYHPPIVYLKRLAPEWNRDRRALRFMRAFNADAARWGLPPDPPLEDWQLAVLRAFYDAEITYQDAQLGRLLASLEQTNMLANTLVIITADHGEAHGEHQFFGHGFGAHPELTRVPLVMAHPEHFPAGRQVTGNLSARRIFHTALDLAGLKPPLDEDDPNADISGLSLAGVAHGDADIEEDTAFSEAYPPKTFLKVLQHHNPVVMRRLRMSEVRRGVYHGEHKLALVDNEVEGLFQITDDPLEIHDISHSNPAVVADLQARVENFARELMEDKGIPDGAINAKVMENLRALGYID